MTIHGSRTYHLPQIGPFQSANQVDARVMHALDWLIPFAFLALALLAPRYGADSRDVHGAAVRRHTVTGDLRRTLRALRRIHEDQVRAWEMFWQLQHPWESEPLRWTEVQGEWRLAGRVVPASKAEPGEGRAQPDGQPPRPATSPHRGPQDRRPAR